VMDGGGGVGGAVGAVTTPLPHLSCLHRRTTQAKRNCSERLHQAENESVVVGNRVSTARGATTTLARTTRNVNTSATRKGYDLPFLIGIR